MTTFVCADMHWSDWFYYDETSPSGLRWNASIRSGKNLNIEKVKVGDVVGCIKTSNSKSYWVTRVRGVNYRVHRIIYELLNNRNLSENEVIDHVDGDSLNNTISNLRATSVAINSRNSSKRSDNTSNVIGVSKGYNGKYYSWVAQWTCHKTGKNLSKRFSTNKYGEELAFSLAVEYRRNMIEDMNAQGAGYTNRSV